MRRVLPAATTILGVALALRVVFHAWFLNYDARYALLWARDAVRGFTPDYEAPFAPTPHPLSTAWSVIALPFGEGGDQLIAWMALLAFGALVYLVYRLGAELFSPAVGIVTALMVLTRPALERDALLAYQDVVFAVLLVGAALLEAQRPRRGAAVLVLLALAGLLRPEAWVLAGLYWLYAGRDWRLVPLVAVAPGMWALVDLVVTGDALHSLHSTSDLAATNDRRRSFSDVPYWTVQYVGFTLRWPGAIGVPLGLAFAWRHRDRFGRAALIPLAIVAVLTVLFALSPAFGLPLIGRYMRVAAALLLLFYGLAACGFLLTDRDKRLWQGVAVVAILASVAYLPFLGSELKDQHDRTALMAQRYRGLRALAHKLPRDCGPITASDHSAVPYLRYWIDGDPGSVVTTEQDAAEQTRVLVIPRRTRATRGLFADGATPGRVPPGYVRLAQTRTWRAVRAPGCQTSSIASSSSSSTSRKVA